MGKYQGCLCVFVWVREMSRRQAPLVWTVRSRCRTAASVCVCVYANVRQWPRVWDETVIWIGMERCKAIAYWVMNTHILYTVHTHAWWACQVIETCSCCVNALCVGLPAKSSAFTHRYSFSWTFCFSLPIWNFLWDFSSMRSHLNIVSMKMQCIC